MHQFEIERVTVGPKHHLFGFHDLVQTNARGDLALSLAVNDISRPPLPGEMCESGVVKIGEPASFHAIHMTHTWNYPQGARQQWIGDSDLFVCNDRSETGDLISWISDARSGKTVDRLPFPAHGLNAKLAKAVYINYDRLHAVGAYGYVPMHACGNPRIVDCPTDDGLWIGDLKTKKADLLVSLADIACCGEKRAVRSGFPHYVTHPLLSPSGRRIAFLHRYRVPDGGEATRLMTIGMDGSGLRCLAKGFLSHFTWTSENEIFIWGAHKPALYALREASYLRYPGVLPMAMLAKRLLKILRELRRQSAGGVSGNPVQSMTFLRVRDVNEMRIEPSGFGVLVEDGHPMARPGQLDLVVNDTYPHADGVRELMLFNVKSEVRTNLGTFKMLNAEPNLSAFDWRTCQIGTDPRILKKFDRKLYMFARSGLHCDLHPRWSYDGSSVLFDSIHEGTRQLYRVKIEGLV